MEHPESYDNVPANSHHASEIRNPVLPTPQIAPIEVDASRAGVDYANFCRLMGAPEELLIDFGFNAHPTGETSPAVTVVHRIVTSWHTAKRLLHVLEHTISRHEAAFGVLETDVQRRIRN